MSEKVILTGSSLVSSVFIKVKRLILERKNIRIMNRLTTITVLDYTTGKVSQYNIEEWGIDEQRIEDVISKVKQSKSWYAGMFEEIANKLNGLPSEEVTLGDARNSLEFVTAVYASSRQNKIIEIPIDKKNKLYNSWLPY